VSSIAGMIPGVVAEYLPDSRECRIDIPGMTDGANEKLLAQVMQAVGDASEKTEIEILPGDRVWVQFEEGDQRFPIIVGYRARNEDNRLDWRRWHHKNIEVLADEVAQIATPNGWVKISGGGAQVDVQAENDVTVTAGSSITATVGGASIRVTSGGITLTVGGSTLSITGGAITLDAARVNLN
jgi:hypothetical protein